jgi:TPP-dependent 2-oxoacid decarboxylase
MSTAWSRFVPAPGTGAAGKLTFIEVVLDRMDLPALLARTADAVANQNR